MASSWPERHVCGKALRGRKSGTFADQQDDHRRVERFADIVEHADSGVMEQKRLAEPPAAVFGLCSEQRQKRRHLSPHRHCGKTVGDRNLQLSAWRTSLAQLGFRTRRKASGPGRAATDNRSSSRPSWPRRKSPILLRTLPRDHEPDRPQPGLHPWRRRDQPGVSATFPFDKRHRPYPSRSARACVPAPFSLTTATELPLILHQEATAARRFPEVPQSPCRSPEQGSD